MAQRVQLLAELQRLRDELGISGAHELGIDALLELASGVVESNEVEQERAARLQASLEEANASKRLSSEFLAVAGHELRNALAPILWAAEAIRREQGAATRHSAIVERHARHLKDLVDNMFEVSAVDTGHVTLRRELVDVHLLLAHAIEATEARFAERKVELSRATPVEPLWLHGDASRLIQVFTNLLSNAAKFTPPGGSVAIDIESLSDELIVRIRDTGIGIPAHVLPRVFEPFFRERAPSTKSPKGFGIGLAVVRSIVELHGGTVQALSEGPGSGATFIVRLPSPPLIEDDEIETAPDAAFDLGLRSFRGTRALVVDASPHSSEAVVCLLERMGCIVRLADHLELALALAREHPHDVVLFDVHLPEGDGYELARRLRNEFGRGALRLVAMKARREGIARTPFDTDADAEISKPVDSRGLLDVFSYLFD